MNLIRNLYLKTQKRKFYRAFKPIGIGRRESFFIVPTENVKDFLKALPFIAGIRKLGSVALFVPEVFSSYLKLFRANYFQIFYYKEIPEILTREFEQLKTELKKINFHWLIDLNQKANLNLPGLVNAEKRVAFYDKGIFPFYNILIKGGIEAMKNFFQIPSVDPISLFKFNKLELKSILKELPQEQPRLFFNQVDKSIKELEKIQWQGAIVYHNKNDEIEIGLKKLYLCDAYCGPDDELCEIARIFKKDISII
ncbi:MAG: hypothetical protein ABIL07_06710 [candidate division WOR-3 bacterium]